MKKIISAIICATLFSVSNAQVNSPKDLYLTKPLKDASLKKITAETSHGNINVSVVPATDARLEVYVRPNNNDEQLSKEEIQKKLDEYYSIEISISGDLLSAVARRKKDILNGQTSLNISFQIYTTKSVATQLKTSHGNVDVSGMEGTQDIVTSHGNIHLEEITGKLTGQTSHGNIYVTNVKDNIDLSTDHGNIEANHCEGTVKLTTSNGNLQLEKLKGKIKASTDHGNIAGHVIDGELSASTSHGDVSLENLSCSVDASTDHGNMFVAVDKITGDIIVNDSGGNISIELPKGKGIDLDLSGKSVDIDYMENFSGSKEKDSIKGTLGGGGTKVKAKTDRGSVSLKFN
jgi:DUF4097 and DUF4098 domain-containing protein YvlB